MVFKAFVTGIHINVCGLCIRATISGCSVDLDLYADLIRF